VILVSEILWGIFIWAHVALIGVPPLIALFFVNKPTLMEKQNIIRPSKRLKAA